MPGRSFSITGRHARLAIVVVDSCMLPRELLDEAKTRAQKLTNIPTDRMLISATHSHTAPSSMGCLGSDADANYVRILPDLLARAIDQANRRLGPAKIGFAVVQRSRSHRLPPVDLSARPDAKRPLRRADRPGEYAPRLLVARRDRSDRANRSRPLDRFPSEPRWPAIRTAGELFHALCRHDAAVSRLLRTIR